MQPQDDRPPEPPPWSFDRPPLPERDPWTFDRPPEPEPAPAPGPVPPLAPPPPRRPWVAVAVIAALVGALFGAGTYGAIDFVRDDDELQPLDVVAAPDRGGDRSNLTFSGTALDLQAVVAKVQPAVVAIGVSGFEGRGAGTGMILTPDGEVLTNAHVVDGAARIQVTLSGENEPRPADLVGSDALADLAIIRIRNAERLPAVELGSSSAALVGDDVVAIGNALALPGGPTITKGIISAKDRTIDNLDGLIQTDTAINQGNSGGPLVNAAGQVIGVNTAVIRGGAEGIGFSIAIDNAKPIIEQLRAGQSGGSGAFLGVSSQTLDATIAERLDLPVEVGAVVAEVVPDSAAEAAGLRIGDAIVELDGQPVRGAASVATIVRSKRPGDTVTVTYYRGDDRRSVQVTLGSRPAVGN